MSIIDWSLSRLRALIGTEQIRQEMARRKDLQRVCVTVGNAIHALGVRPEAVEGSLAYARMASIIELLSPMDLVGAEYIRVGSSRDGGYVMARVFDGGKVGAAYSFGIANDASWDDDIAAMGIPVYMFDHTIKAAPACPRARADVRFFRIGISGWKEDPELLPMREILKRNGHGDRHDLLLKMDVEGAEWEAIDAMDVSDLRRFSQIALELHGLTPFESRDRHALMLGVLSKLHRTHQSVHVHANSWVPQTWIRDLVLPSCLEATFVRRDGGHEFVPCTRYFPTPLDASTFSGLPDVDLGMFQVKHGG